MYVYLYYYNFFVIFNNYMISLCTDVFIIMLFYSHLHTPIGSSHNIRKEAQSCPSPQLPPGPDDSIKCVEDAKTRDLPPITTHDDILKHKVHLCSFYPHTKNNGASLMLEGFI